MLAVLAVRARSRVPFLDAGESLCSVLGLEAAAGDAVLGAFVPKENLRPAALIEKAGRDSGIGGTGISCKALRSETVESSWIGTSVDDGRVDEELKRAEEEELSYRPPVEAELLVPPLPLKEVNVEQ